LSRPVVQNGSQGLAKLVPREGWRPESRCEEEKVSKLGLREQLVIESTQLHLTPISSISEDSTPVLSFRQEKNLWKAQENQGLGANAD
jgi:hypothetical protein